MSDVLDHFAAALEQLPAPADLGPDDVDLVLAVLAGQREFTRALTARWAAVAEEVRSTSPVDPPPALGARVAEIARRGLRLAIAEKLLDPYLSRALQLEDEGRLTHSSAGAKERNA